VATGSAFNEHYQYDQIKKNEMDGTCSTHGRGEMHTECWLKNVKRLCANGRIILKWIKK
jgi:hypothetical protein